MHGIPCRVLSTHHVERPCRPEVDCITSIFNRLVKFSNLLVEGRLSKRRVVAVYFRIPIVHKILIEIPFPQPILRTVDIALFHHASIALAIMGEACTVRMFWRTANRETGALTNPVPVDLFTRIAIGLSPPIGILGVRIYPAMLNAPVRIQRITSSRLHILQARIEYLIRTTKNWILRPYLNMAPLVRTHRQHTNHGPNSLFRNAEFHK